MQLIYRSVIILSLSPRTIANKRKTTNNINMIEGVEPIESGNMNEGWGRVANPTGLWDFARSYCGYLEMVYGQHKASNEKTW